MGNDRSASGGARMGPGAEPLVLDAGVQGDRADDHPGREPGVEAGAGRGDALSGWSGVRRGVGRP